MDCVKAKPWYRAIEGDGVSGRGRDIGIWYGIG